MDKETKKIKPLTEDQIDMVMYAYRRMGFVSNSDNAFMGEIFSNYADGKDIDQCIAEEQKDRINMMDRN